MPKPPRRVILPPLDRAALKEASLAYLARFAATKQKTAMMLERKIMRWGFKAEKAGMPATAISEIQENARSHLEAIIVEMVAAGAINDLEFGRSKVRHHAGRKSRKVIAAGLAAKGLRADALEEALENELGEADSEKSYRMELQAALRLARKRHIGPFRKKENEAEMAEDDFAFMAKFSKEMGIFARGGFSAEMAGNVLKMSEERAVEILEDQTFK